jgi:hypothetical protein
MCFTARPRMGGRRAVRRQRRGGSRRDRPLMGSRPRPPLRGRAVTTGGDGSKFLRGYRLQGVSYLIDGFGVSIRIPRNSLRIRVCNPATIFADFLFLLYGPRGRGLGTRFFFRLSRYKNLHPDPVSGNRGRHLRTPPTQPGGSAAGAGLRRTRSRAGIRCEAAASVGYAHAPGGEATMAGRGAWRLDGEARRVETIAPSSPPPVLLGCRHPHRLARRFLLLPCPSGRRWRRRRHRTCVHRRA